MNSNARENGHFYGVSWVSAFVAVSVILGETAEESMACLDPEAQTAARDLVTRLSHESKQARAVTLAREVTKVVAKLDEVAL